jgi:hypothetical protein
MDNQFKSLYNLFHTQATIVKEAYESGDILGIQPHIEVMFSNPDELIILTYDEFINKLITDVEFANDWFVEVNIKVLNLDERYKLYQDGNIKYKIFTATSHDFNINDIPTKLITITYKDKVIESYE